MSASTTTPSPTVRLTGNRPASTSGDSASMTTRRRASGRSPGKVAWEGAEAVNRRLAGARATDSIVARCAPIVCRPKRTFDLGRGGFLDLVERADHGRALVLDVIHPRGLGDTPSLPGADVELEPQRFGPDCHRLARDFGRVGRGPEHVDQVDWLLHIQQRAIDALAEKLVGERVDRDYPKASLLQSRRHRAAGLARVARRAYHGDGARSAKYLLRRFHAFEHNRVFSARNSVYLCTKAALGRFGLALVRRLERDPQHVFD